VASCFLGPVASQPQLGCALIVHQTALGAAPTVEVMRDDVRVDITGAVYVEQVLLPVSYPRFGCDGEIESVATRRETFEVFHISIDSGRAGEQVFVNGSPAGTMREFTTLCGGTGTPTFSCGVDGCDGSENGGCHTSGNSCGAAFTLLVAALVIARRRRHVRARTAADA
jgi:uncharacterized protein (TIGR03382 family)